MSADVRLKPLISVTQAGVILGIGTTTAYEWARRGDLPGLVQHGGRNYVRRAVVEAYVRGDDVLDDPARRPALKHLDGRSREGAR